MTIACQERCLRVRDKAKHIGLARKVETISLTSQDVESAFSQRDLALLTRKSCIDALVHLELITDASSVMPNPNSGSALHPNPRHTSIPSKPRLPPRVPQPRTPYVQQEVPKVGINPLEAQRGAEATNIRTLWDTIIRRKKLVGAIAFAVVTVAGTLLGARLKETSQEYEKMKELQEAAERLVESPASMTTDGGPVLQAAGALQSGLIGAASPLPSGSEQINPAYNVDVAKQIALLEDRKALLNRQRFNFEQKIAKLRERQARKEQMEARRPASINVNR